MGGQGFEQDVKPGALVKGDPTQYDYDTIVSYLREAQPLVLAEVGRAYASTQRAFEQADSGLAGHVRQLSSAWEGASQELGVADLKRLAESASVLAAASAEFQSAMNQAQGVVEVAKASTPAKSATPGVLPGNSPMETADKKTADDKAAQAHLAKTNAGLANAYAQIPEAVSLELPRDGGNIGRERRPGADLAAGGGSVARRPGGGSGASDGGKQSPTLGSGDRLHGHGPSPGDSSPRGPVHGGSPNPSDLEGVKPVNPGGGPGHVPPGTGPISPGVGGGLPPTGGPSPGMAFPGLGAIPGSGGGVPTGLRGGLGGGAGMRPGAFEPVKGMRGVIGTAAPSEVPRPRTGMESGRGAMGNGTPTGTGTDRKGGRRNERSTWLVEDDEVWREEGGTAPRVIGAEEE